MSNILWHNSFVTRQIYLYLGWQYIGLGKLYIDLDKKNKQKIFFVKEGMQILLKVFIDYYVLFRNNAIFCLITFFVATFYYEYSLSKKFYFTLMKFTKNFIYFFQIKFYGSAVSCFSKCTLIVICFQKLDFKPI